MRTTLTVVIGTALLATGCLAHSSSARTLPTPARTITPVTPSAVRREVGHRLIRPFLKGDHLVNLHCDITPLRDRARCVGVPAWAGNVVRLTAWFRIALDGSVSPICGRAQTRIFCRG